MKEKIKVKSAEIVVNGTADKPYYEIKYYDISDGKYHIGYSSYDIHNVFQWLEDCFDIIHEETETYNESDKGDLISRTATIKALEEGVFVPDWNLALAQTIVANQPTAHNDGWIPVSSGKLPEDCDNRFYMCIVENHEEDLPMFCQYDEEYGFGFWHDIYDEHTLGFVDSEFKTNKELGYEEVIAWQPLPEPYKAESEE